MYKIQPLSQIQRQRLGNIPSSIGAINKLRPVQKLGSSFNKQKSTSDSSGNLSDYNDPKAINSVADVLTRAGTDSKPTGAVYAVGATLDLVADFIPKVEGATIATSTVLNILGKTIKAGALIADEDFREYIKNYYIHPALEGDWSAVGYNALQGFSETADLTAQLTKSFIPLAGGSAQAGLNNLEATVAGMFGIDTGYGRTNYDYNTGHWISDMALEVLTDPMNLLDYAGAASGFIAKSTRGVDVVSKRLNKGRVHKIGKLSKEATENTVSTLSGPTGTVVRAVDNSNKVSKKLQKVKSKQERYIRKRTAILDKDFEKLKQNKQKEFIDKWRNTFKEWAKSDPKYTAPEYTTNEGVLNLLETGFLDKDYKIAINEIDLGHKRAIEQLSLPDQHSMRPNQDIGEGWQTVNVYDSSIPDLPGGEKVTASDVDTFTEYKAQSYVELVENNYNRQKYKPLEAAEQKVEALEAAPDYVKKTKTWQRTHSHAKAQRDKLRTEVNINMAQSPSAKILSEDNIQKLSKISTRPSENEQLLKGVGGATTTVLRTVGKIQDVANEVDKRTIQLATLGLAKNIRKAGWHFAKFAGRNVLKGVRYLKFFSKVNKTLQNSTEHFFSQYTTSEGVLDLSKFPKLLPEYTNFIHRTKTYYSGVIKEGEESFFKLPDYKALANKVKESASHLRKKISDAYQSNKSALQNLDDVLSMLKEAMPTVVTSEVPLLTYPDKIAALRKYITYLQNLAKLDGEGTFDSTIRVLVQKIERLIDKVNIALGFDKQRAIVEEYNKAVSYSSQLDSLKKLTDNASSIRDVIANPSFQIADNVLPALDNGLKQLIKKAPDVVKDMPLVTVADKVTALQRYVDIIDSYVVQVELKRSLDIEYGKYTFEEILQMAEVVCSYEDYIQIENKIQSAAYSRALNDFKTRAFRLRQKISDAQIHLDDTLLSDLQTIREDYIELLDVLTKLAEIPSLKREVIKKMSPLLDIKDLIQKAYNKLMDFTGWREYTEAYMDNPSLTRIVPDRRPGMEGKYTVRPLTFYEQQKLHITSAEGSLNTGIEQSGLLDKADAGIEWASYSTFEKEVVIPLENVINTISLAENKIQAAVTSYDNTRKKRYKKALAILDTEEKLSTSYVDRIKQYIKDVDANKTVTLKLETSETGVVEDYTISINDLLTNPARSPLLVPIFVDTIDEKSYKEFTNSYDDVLKNLTELFDNTGFSDQHDLRRHFETLILNNTKADDGYKSLAYSEYLEKLEKATTDLVSEEAISEKLIKFFLANAKHSTALQKLYNEKPLAFRNVLENTYLKNYEQDSYHTWLTDFENAVKVAVEEHWVYQKRLEKINKFDVLFRKVYELYSGFSKVSSVSQYDTALLSDLINARADLQAFISLIPDGDYATAFKQSVEELLQKSIQVTKTFNIDPSKKSYQIFLSTTAAYLDFTTDDQVVALFDMLRSPKKDSSNVFEQLLYHFKHAVTDTTSGAWLAETSFSKFFNEADYNFVNEALIRLNNAATEHYNQLTFIERVFTNPAFSLSHFAETDAKRDLLRIAILDSFTRYNRKSGEGFIENFNYYFDNFVKALETNEICSLSNQSYALSNLKETFLKGSRLAKAEKLSSHDAADDCRITDLVLEQWEDTYGAPLFDADPNAIDITIDLEFSSSTDVSKGTYIPFQLAYKQGDVVNNIHIDVSEEDADWIDQRTLDFFKENPPAGHTGDTFTREDFKKYWCNSKNASRDDVFYKFFLELYAKEQADPGKYIRLRAHNGAQVEIPLLENEFNRVKYRLLKDPSMKFIRLEELDNWFNSIKLHSIDTLACMRKQDGFAALDTIQLEELKQVVSEYVQSSYNSPHLMRAIDDSFFEGINALRASMTYITNAHKFIPVDDVDEVISEAPGVDDVLYNQFLNELNNAKDLIKGKLGKHKAKELTNYAIYADDIAQSEITLGDLRLSNITALNNAAGIITTFGFKRVSTPELLHIFKDEAVEFAVRTNRTTEFVEEVSKIYASIDKIRYPKLLQDYAAELSAAFDAFVALGNEIINAPGKVPGKEPGVFLLQRFQLFKKSEHLPTLFAIVRHMHNSLTDYAERHPNFNVPQSPITSKVLLDLFNNSNPELYTNRLNTEGFKVFGEKTREMMDVFDEELDTFRRRAKICCTNEIERLENVSTYLESLNKLGYKKYTNTKLNLIKTRILPIVDAFDSAPKEYLENAKELFKTIPQKQLDNRFSDFVDGGKKLYQDLLYNPLHVLITHKSDLQKYGDIAAYLQKYRSAIQYKELADGQVYLYLTKDELSKYTFEKGVPYLANKAIARPAYKDPLQGSVIEVDKLRKEIINLYELPEDYFSDSCGRMFSEDQIVDIYQRLPDEIRSELLPIVAIQKNVADSGPVINNILLGNWYMQSRFIAGKVHDPIASFTLAAQSVARDMDLRTQWLHYFFDNSDGLSLMLDDTGKLVSNNLLDNLDYKSVSDLCAALEVNRTYTLTALIPEKDKLRVFELPLSNPDIVKRFIELRQVPIRLMTKSEALTVKNIVERATYNKLQKFWNLGIRVFKNAVLMSLGNLLRNTVDTFLKTTIDIGALDTINYSFEAHKLRREYNKVIELATEASFLLEDGTQSAGLFNNKVLDYLFSPAHQSLLKSKGITIDRDTFEFIRAFKESDAAGAMNKYQENQKRYQRAFLKSAEHLENPNLTFNDWLRKQNTLKGALKKGQGLKQLAKGTYKSVEGVYNNLLSWAIAPTSYIEDVNRLAMYLKYSDEGLLTKTAIFQKIKDTHFDFNYKTNITNKIEQFIPFYNFTKENAVYWLRLLDERPDLLKVLTDIMTPILDLDSYDVEELERNRSLVNTITNGYIRMDKQTDLMLKLNPSFMDAFTLFTNPVDAFQQRFIIDLPQSRKALMQWEGGWKDALIESTNTVIASWPTTITQRIKAILRNQQRLNKAYESTQTPLIRQGLVRAAASVSSTFTVPARYRNAKYTSDQYYRRWRNYRSPVRSIYTKTGISKLTILMEPVSPDNIKYKLGVMQSFVNRQ